MERKKSIESVVLCFCPLFIVVESTIQGLVIGILSSLVLLITGLTIWIARKLIVFEIHILCILLIAATVTAILEKILVSQYYGLYQILGIYLPLIAINSFTLTRIEMVFFVKNISVLLQKFLSYMVNIILCFTVFGSVRELLISGTTTKKLLEVQVVNTIFAKDTGVLFLLAILLLLLNYLPSFKNSNKVVD